MINPELQFSGNNEVATVKLDIFGEIVVTLGTTPQGQGHETTAAQVVADILQCSVDDVHVRAGHDSYWNSHAGFSGTYASQFAVTGLSAVKGATDMLAAEIKKLASAVFGGVPEEALELAEGSVRIKDNPEAALPFMACGAIINANNAGLPEDLGVTLNCRYVYRPPFEVPDVERKFGNLTLTYAAQVHVAVIEIDPETGYYDIVDYAAVDDCGKRINPQIVEGQVMGATAQALGGVMHEQFVYDEDGNLLTPNFYDYHVPHALDMPPLKTGYVESPSPFTPLGTKGMGEGGGAGIHAVCAAVQDALRARGGAIVVDSANPYHRSGRCSSTPSARARTVTRWTHERSGRAHVRRAAAGGVGRAERPGVDGEDDARRRELRRARRAPLDGEREDPARPRRPEDEDRHGQDRGARARVRAAADQGPGRRRDAEHGDVVRAEATPPAAPPMKWAADVKIAGPVGSMGQRVLQPIVNQQVAHVLDGARQAGARGDGERRRRPRKARRTTARRLTRTPRPALRPVPAVRTRASARCRRRRTSPSPRGRRPPRKTRASACCSRSSTSRWSTC